MRSILQSAPGINDALAPFGVVLRFVSPGMFQRRTLSQLCLLCRHLASELSPPPRSITPSANVELRGKPWFTRRRFLILRCCVSSRWRVNSLLCRLGLIVPGFVLPIAPCIANAHTPAVRRFFFKTCLPCLLFMGEKAHTMHNE